MNLRMGGEERRESREVFRSGDDGDGEVTERELMGKV